MAELLRRLLNFLTALSLLLCAATAALWVRSYWVGDRLEWNRERRETHVHDWWQTSLASECGGLSLYHRHGTETSAGGGNWHVWRADDAPGLRWRRATAHRYPRPIDGPRPDFRRWGFLWDRDFSDDENYAGDGRRVYRKVWVVVPHALLALLTAALPATRAPRLVRRWIRKRRGLCARCGYDLHTKPGRCPECGTMTPAPPPHEATPP